MQEERWGGLRKKVTRKAGGGKKEKENNSWTFLKAVLRGIGWFHCSTRDCAGSWGSRGFLALALGRGTIVSRGEKFFSAVEKESRLARLL